MSTKGARFIRELAKGAKQRGLKFKVSKRRGKGSHVMVWVGDRVTTVPSRDIDPTTAKKIRKQLGLDD
jgi:predicted RNA binding protein YcfA (HicA-like mRNA interferase family)